MHLLNTSTLQLESFDYDVPAYAILSHTWGKTADEVTYQDVTRKRESYNQKLGYKKIKFCAKTAAARGLRYCWVDSCCIDKSSSSQLSEAINSMYSWYEKSAECYVYLTDVDACVSDLESQFLKSRWFDRGWTLQELIAPRSLLFFDRNRVCIGKVKHRSMQSVYESGGFSFNTTAPHDTEAEGLFEPPWLARVVHERTGITRQTLISGNCRKCSVGTKMSWASTRQTSRKEDMAYCLMGIFDINMPLMYGEGDKAFLRLQEEILKKNTDHTLFAWRGNTGSSFNGLLSPSPAYFKWIREMGLPSVASRVFLNGADDSSYQMTNNGLRIKLRLCSIPTETDSQGEYQVLIAEDGRFVYFINLKRLNENGQFARVDVQKDFSVESQGLSPCASFRCSCISEWIYVRQSFEGLPIFPCSDRMSGIVLQNSTLSFFDVRLTCVAAVDEPEQMKTVFHLQPGQDFETMYQLTIEPFRGTRPEETTVAWLIQSEGNGERGREEIVSRFSHMNWLGLDDFQWNWQDCCEIGRNHMYIISSRVEFEIVAGELIARIKLESRKNPIQD